MQLVHLIVILMDDLAAVMVPSSLYSDDRWPIKSLVHAHVHGWQEVAAGSDAVAWESHATQ